MTIWFTSDLHLGHTNIIEHCNRPFDSVDEMDHTLITNWNRKVKDNDTIYCIGDFTLTTRIEKAEDYINQLNGNITFIWGNHDKWLDKICKAKSLFLVYYHAFNYNNTHYVLSHFPFQTWNKSHRGSIHLHGHCHGKLGVVSAPNRLDVGVDCHDYMPISIEEINSFLK